MYEYCLGIRPSSSGGFANVTFAPFLDPTGKITQAEGHYDTTYGRITVAWERVGDSFTYVVTAPASISCSFSFPRYRVTKEESVENTYHFLLE